MQNNVIKYLIYVNSPLQLLCAIEFIMKQSSSLDYAVFIFGKDVRRIPQEDEIARLFGVKIKVW